MIVKTKFEDKVFDSFVKQGGGVIAPSPFHLQGVHSCIAPDESYTIFTAMYESWGKSPELFITYREAEDTWGNAINLSNVLDMKDIMIPYISPDEEYLFFYHDHDIYWVDLMFLKKIKND